MEKLGIILSGFAEVRGLSSFPRFTRQWLCLTNDKFLVCRDSSLISQPTFSVSCDALHSLHRVPLRRYCISVETGLRRLHISFSERSQLEEWTNAIHQRIHPVLLIGELYADAEETPVESYPVEVGNVINQERWDNDSSTLASPSTHTRFRNRRHQSQFSEGTTLVAGSSAIHSLLPSKAKSELDFVSSLLPSWLAPVGSDSESGSFAEFSDILILSDDQLFDQSKLEQTQTRPPSPLDPNLIFDIGRVYLEPGGPRRPLAENNISLSDLTGQVTKNDEFPFAIGGFADVWLGTWNTVDRCHIVAIKVLRAFSAEDGFDNKIRTRLRKELDIWKGLKHRNVVPLLGICHDMGRYASMVSPWMRNGNAAKYLERRNLQENLGLVPRLKLLSEVATGLEYLHNYNPPVIHGDMKAANILINDNGEALLSDFGISTLIEDATGSECFASTSFAGSVRWMAFELLHIEADETPQLTTWCDIWSYGSTVLEILSGKPPYHHRKNDIQVLHEVLRGMKPRHEGTGFPSDIWSFVQSCWSDTPGQRPTISAVTKYMQKAYRERCRMGIVVDVRRPTSQLTLDIGSDIFDIRA